MQISDPLSLEAGDEEKVDSWDSVLQLSVGFSCKLLNPEDSE